MTTADKDNWVAETIRFTFFPMPEAEINSPEDWWEAFVGSPPEQISNKPKEGSTNVSGTLQDEELKLILNIQPERIDWQLIPNVESPDEMPDNIGNLVDRMPLILEPITNWLNNIDIEINRIAYGVILLKKAENRASSYETLNSLLHEVNIDSEGSSDFIYQINRKRPSKHMKGLEINRLSRWSSMAFGKFKIPNIGTDSITTPLTVSQTVSSTRLELDINTSATSTNNIQEESRDAIINELIELGNEIADNGDTK